LTGPLHAILILSPDITVLHASPGAATLFGADSVSALIGSDAFDLVADTEDERARAMVRQRLADRLEGSRGPWRLERRDGTVFVAEIEITTLEEPDRELRILLSILDTSKQRRTSRALERALEWTDHLLDVSGTIIVVLESSGEVSRINAEGCRILGHPREWIIGKDWVTTFLPERDRDAVRLVADRAFAGTIEPVEFYENSVLTARGDERIIYWHNTITRDDDGTVLESISSGLDITDRVDAERRYRTVFERAANPIARLSMDGTILDCNIQTERVFG